MKLLVTGGSSFLGSHVLKRAPHEWQIAATYCSHPITQENIAAFCVDLRDENAVRHVVAEIQPDVIIHTPAAMDGELLNTLNVNGSRHITLAAKEAHARLIHISSDVIFDGEHAPYNERAQPQPITPYAISKAQAERIVAEIFLNPVIIRTSLIYGFDPIDPRTRAILDGKLPHLFTDEFRCPIYANDLADALLELVASNFTGAMNVAGPQKLSRYEFGLKLAHAFQSEPKFKPALSASHPTPRPRDVALDISLAHKILKTKLQSVDEAMAVRSNLSNNETNSPHL